jgi:transposase
LTASEEARRRLELIISDLRHDRFGPKSEKLTLNQYKLPLEDVEIAEGMLDAAQEKAETAIRGKPSRDRLRNANRGRLPAHLPHIGRMPQSVQCPCGRSPMTMIGEYLSVRLDVVPAQFRMMVTRRPKYASRRCSGAVVQAHAPEHVVPGGLPTEAMITHMIVAKFGEFASRPSARTLRHDLLLHRHFPSYEKPKLISGLELIEVRNKTIQTQPHRFFSTIHGLQDHIRDQLYQTVRAAFSRYTS